MSFAERLDDLLEELAVFDDWQERYEYIISLGKQLPPLPEQYRRTENLIKGCQSEVWVGTELREGKLTVYADSTSLVTKGLIAVFVRLFSGLPPQEIASADLARLRDSGLHEHFVSTRANALNTMAETLMHRAADLCRPCK